MNKSLSVIIPCYNEKNRILETLIKTYRYLREHEYNFEIIIVSDGSTDNTLEVVAPMVEAHKEVSLISYKTNRGKGYAVKIGVEAAKKDWVLFSDADNATRIEMIERFFDIKRENEGAFYQIFYGSRNLKESNIVIKQPFVRQLMGRVFATLVRMFMRTELKDTQCGFKMFENKVAKKLFEMQTIERFAFDVELTMNAEKVGYVIAEVPVDWYNNEESKVNGLKSAIKMLEDVIILWKIKNL